MITNIANTLPIIPNYKNNYTAVNTKLLINNQKQDYVSFGNNPLKFVQTKDPKEIKNLVNLFIKSINDNFEPQIQNPKKEGKLSQWIEKLSIKILAMPYIWVSKLNSSVTEIIKKDGILAGGYSFNMATATKSAHINFLTIAPEFKTTKSSGKMLLEMANRIYTKAKENGMEHLTWTTSVKNTRALKLFSRLKAENIKTYAGSEKEFKISLENFKKHLDKYNQRISK